MRIRTIIQQAEPTLEDLYTAVFAATISQAHQGEWIIASVVPHPQTAAHLRILEWLGLFWDEGPEPDDPNINEYDIPNLTEESLSQHDKTHAITHELVLSQGQPLNHALETIQLPAIKADLSPQIILHEDYLPQAVWHTLLMIGWPQARQAQPLTSYQVKQRFTMAQLADAESTLTETVLRATNKHYVNSLAADLLANRIKPYLEEWYGPMPSDNRWLNQLAATIRPYLSHFADAPDMAGWAFQDGWELTTEAETHLTKPEVRPLLVSLVAEVAHIVLLDQATAQTILSALKKRFEASPVDITILALLTGQTACLFEVSAVMSTLGKAETLYRIGEILR